MRVWRGVGIGFGLWLGAALLGGSALRAQEGAPEVRQGAESGLTLGSVIRLALEGSRELEMARFQLSAADAQVREAWSAVFPSLSASASYTRNLAVPGQFLPAQMLNPDAEPGELILVRFGSDNSWFGQLRMEQPLFHASAFIGVGAAGRFQAFQTELVRGRTQEIVTRAKQRYFDLLLAQEGVRLNEESVRRVEAALSETRAMERAGLVGEFDVLRLEVELANLEASLRRARNSASAAQRSLAVELGLEEEAAALRISGSLASFEFEAFPASGGQEGGLTAPSERSLRLEALFDLARSSRSDLRQMRLDQDLRRAELRAEQSEYLPRVSFFAVLGLSAQADGSINPFGWGDARSVSNPQAGLQVSVPLFNGFRRPARIDRGRATLAASEVQSRLTLAQIENQIETLFDQIEEAGVRARVQASAVNQARRGFEIASAQFREGMGSRLELIDAEIALRQSEFNHAQALHDLATARTQLELATGSIPEVP